MSNRNNPSVIRLLMFTGKECHFCPEVEAIVRNFVNTTMGSKVNVTTIDVDLSPDIANKFKINQLPTVVLGNEVLITGYMNESEIRDRLWNKIFHSILAKDSSQERIKERIFSNSRNVIKSVTEKQLIRPNIGDYAHIGALQITNMSLLSLDKLASLIIYDSGKMEGLYGIGHMMLSSINPEIHNQIKISAKFKEIIDSIVSFLSNNEKFPLFIAEEAKLVSFTETTAIIRVFGSSFSVQSPNLGEPLCWSLAGEISGWVKSFLGKSIKVTEIACWGLGNTYCDFFIEILEEEPSPAIIDYKGKEELTQRRTSFQNTLMVMADNFQKSHFLQKRLRNKFGDYVHISVIQNLLSALKLKDEFLGLLLHSAGSIFGLTGPGKHIIQNMISDLKIKQPMDLNDAVKLVTLELKHPTTLLTRQHSFVEYEVIEEDEIAEILIYENVYASGVGNVGVTFCDFTAGFIHGRLQLLLLDNISVIEKNCHGRGDSYCSFTIKIE